MKAVKVGDKAIWFRTQRGVACGMVAVVVHKVMNQKAQVRFKSQTGLLLDRHVNLSQLEPIAERRIPDSVFQGLF